MKRIIVALVLALGAIAPSVAQIVSNGPYYATPSWDQTVAHVLVVVSDKGMQLHGSNAAVTPALKVA